MVHLTHFLCTRVWPRYECNITCRLVSLQPLNYSSKRHPNEFPLPSKHQHEPLPKFRSRRRPSKHRRHLILVSPTRPQNRQITPPTALAISNNCPVVCIFPVLRFTITDDILVLEVSTGNELPTLTIISSTPCTFTFPINHDIHDSPCASPLLPLSSLALVRSHYYRIHYHHQPSSAPHMTHKYRRYLRLLLTPSHKGR
jgi:hypothetical protein